MMPALHTTNSFHLIWELVLGRKDRAHNHVEKTGIVLQLEYNMVIFILMENHSSFLLPDVGWCTKEKLPQLLKGRRNGK